MRPQMPTISIDVDFDWDKDAAEREKKAEGASPARGVSGETWIRARRWLSEDV